MGRATKIILQGSKQEAAKWVGWAKQRAQVLINRTLQRSAGKPIQGVKLNQRASQRYKPAPDVTVIVNVFNQIAEVIVRAGEEIMPVLLLPGATIRIRDSSSFLSASTRNGRIRRIGATDRFSPDHFFKVFVSLFNARQSSVLRKFVTNYIVPMLSFPGGHDDIELVGVSDYISTDDDENERDDYSLLFMPGAVIQSLPSPGDRFRFANLSASIHEHDITFFVIKSVRSFFEQLGNEGAIYLRQQGPESDPGWSVSISVEADTVVIDKPPIPDGWPTGRPSMPWSTDLFHELVFHETITAPPEIVVSNPSWYPPPDGGDHPPFIGDNADLINAGVEDSVQAVGDRARRRRISVVLNGENVELNYSELVYPDNAVDAVQKTSKDVKIYDILPEAPAGYAENTENLYSGVFFNAIYTLNGEDIIELQRTRPELETIYSVVSGSLPQATTVDIFESKHVTFEDTGGSEAPSPPVFSGVDNSLWPDHDLSLTGFSAAAFNIFGTSLSCLSGLKNGDFAYQIYNDGERIFEHIGDPLGSSPQCDLLGLKNIYAVNNIAPIPHPRFPGPPGSLETYESSYGLDFPFSISGKSYYLFSSLVRNRSLKYLLFDDEYVPVSGDAYRVTDEPLGYGRGTFLAAVAMTGKAAIYIAADDPESPAERIAIYSDPDADFTLLDSTGISDRNNVGLLFF